MRWGDVGPDLAAHRPERLDEQGHGGDAVGIEVTIDGHRLAELDGLSDAGAGLGHAAHEQRVVQEGAGVEKSRDRSGVTLITVVEQAGQ